ncbi:UDP-4-amino-4,6-dideoxy-N-acetyl-beta-L-altrosamine N-acetyltransferase [Candidatus Ventrimonas sp. KK005]
MDIFVRKIRANDLEMILKWRTSPKITKYMKTDPELTLDMQKAWFENLKTDSTQKHWVIEINGIPAGLIYLSSMDTALKKCQWGYYIGEKKQSSFAVAISLECSLYDYVLEDLGFEEICCECLAVNTGVIQLHKYTGNHINGILKNNVKKKDTFYDLVLMSIRSEEWKRKRSEMEYEKIQFR